MRSLVCFEDGIKELWEIGYWSVKNDIPALHGWRWKCYITMAVAFHI